MKNFLFDVECMASLRLDAQNRREAKKRIQDALDSADFNPYEDMIGEISYRTVRCVEADGQPVDASADSMEGLLRELVNYCREEFDEDESIEVNGGDMVEWFAEFRERVKKVLL